MNRPGEITLEWQQVAVQQVERDLPGLHRVKATTQRDVMRDALVHSLTAYVLSENAGPPVRSVRTRREEFEQHVRPRWLPRFLWRRIPTRTCTVSVTARAEAQATWIYPQATVRLPDVLGPARFAVMPRSGFPMRDEEWYR